MHAVRVKVHDSAPSGGPLGFGPRMARVLLTSQVLTGQPRRLCMRNRRCALWRMACVGLALAGPISLAAAEPPPDGKTVFVEQKCTKCHSAPGIKGGKADLSGVGKRRAAEWMTKWLKKEEQIDGKKHKKAFTGTPLELEAVVKWLATLK